MRWSLEDGVIAKEFSEIKVGIQLIGWIKNIMPYGVFVEFPYGLVGLAPKSVSSVAYGFKCSLLFSPSQTSCSASQAMADKFIGDTTMPFQVGQTVTAKVTNLDEEKHRFLITLKITELMTREGDAQTRLIDGLQEREAVADALALRGNNVMSLDI